MFEKWLISLIWTDSALWLFHSMCMQPASMMCAAGCRTCLQALLRLYLTMSAQYLSSLDVMQPPRHSHIAGCIGVFHQPVNVLQMRLKQPSSYRRIFNVSLYNYIINRKLLRMQHEKIVFVTSLFYFYFSINFIN